MKLAHCKKHDDKEYGNLVCLKIRHDNGEAATQQEIWGEILRLQKLAMLEDAGYAALIHYPEHWDTAAYPTLDSAVREALAWAGCSVCKEPEATGWRPT